MHLLENVVGIKNYCNIDPQTMGRRFQTVPMMGMLANIADSDGLTVLKRAVSYDSVPYEVKGGASGSFKPYATFVFSMNQMPALADSTGGMMRRIHPVPFAADFRGREDRNLREKLAEEECLEAAIAIGVAALRRMLRTGDVTKTRYSVVQAKSIEVDNNQITQFFEDSGWDTESLAFVSTSKLYESYKDWADNARIRNVYTSRRFRSRVVDMTNMDVKKTTIGGDGYVYRYVPR